MFSGLFAALTGNHWMFPVFYVLAFRSKEDAAPLPWTIGAILLIQDRPIGWLYFGASGVAAIWQWRTLWALLTWDYGAFLRRGGQALRIPAVDYRRTFIVESLSAAA